MYNIFCVQPERKCRETCITAGYHQHTYFVYQNGDYTQICIRLGSYKDINWLCVVVRIWRSTFRMRHALTPFTLVAINKTKPSDAQHNKHSHDELMLNLNLGTCAAVAAALASAGRSISVMKTHRMRPAHTNNERPGSKSHTRTHRDYRGFSQNSTEVQKRRSYVRPNVS